MRKQTNFKIKGIIVAGGNIFIWRNQLTGREGSRKMVTPNEVAARSTEADI